MSDIEWKDWTAVSVEESQRNDWAENLVAQIRLQYPLPEGHEYTRSSMMSGDSFVTVDMDENGVIEVRDCLVRRTAIIYPEYMKR